MHNRSCGFKTLWVLSISDLTNSLHLMYVYILYMRRYIHTYIHTYIYTHTYTHTHIHTYIYTYIHIYISKGTGDNSNCYFLPMFVWCRWCDYRGHTLISFTADDYKGSFNYDDTMTTNLYLGNINPKVGEAQAPSAAYFCAWYRLTLHCWNVYFLQDVYYVLIAMDIYIYCINIL